MTDTLQTLNAKLQNFYIEEKKLQQDIKDMYVDLIRLQNNIAMLQTMIKFKQYERSATDEKLLKGEF